MSASGQRPVFLARSSYRQRRLRDAARVLPLVGVVAFLIPLLWLRRAGAEPAATSSVLLYLFGCWLLLIVATFVLSRRIRADDGAADTSAAEEQYHEDLS